MTRILLLLFVLLGLALPQNADAQSGYRLKPGDTIRLQVVEDSTLNSTLLILPDGSVNVPNVGAVTAAGRTVDNLTAQLRSLLSPLFAQTPTVFLSVAALAEPAPPRPQIVAPAATPPVIEVFALGEFNNPGRFEVSPGTTLLQFIATSGGISRFAATKRLQLRRVQPDGTEQVYAINYRQLAAGLRRSKPIILTDGDVILAPQRRLFE